MKLTEQDLQQLAKEFGIEVEKLKAVDTVESGGKGFDTNGKIIIQFEPSWFKRLAKKEYDDYLKICNKIPKDRTPSEQSFYLKFEKVLSNKVSLQVAEWENFNLAFAINPNVAMESTSIGRFQVMGFHWKLLGFKSVGEMWDFAKNSEKNQVWLGLKFIQSNKKMFDALKNGDWARFAYFYNGEQYKKFNYDVRLKKGYETFKK